MKNEYIRGSAKAKIGSGAKEGRLRWYGHVMRTEAAYVAQKVLRMELSGKRKKGRPNRRFMDGVTTDMEELGLTEEDVEDRVMWRRTIHGGDP